MIRSSAARYGFALLIWFLSAVGAAAQSDALTDGIAAYRDGDYRRAAQLLDPLAQNGSARARYYLGALLWRQGQGGAAQRLFCQAAGQGDRGAMTACGLGYQSGLGGEVSPTAAKRWLERAALAGDDRAMVHLAMLLLDGGRDADRLRAVDWLKRSHDPQAAYLLASLSEQGLAPTMGRPELYALYRRAADAGEPDAQLVVAQMLEHGDGVSADLGAARSYYERAANNGSAAGAFAYAGCLRGGVGGPSDAATAHAWYVIAGRLGDRVLQERINDILVGWEPTLDAATLARSAAIVAAWRARPVPVRLPIAD